MHNRTSHETTPAYSHDLEEKKRKPPTIINIHGQSRIRSPPRPDFPSRCFLPTRLGHVVVAQPRVSRAHDPTRRAADLQILDCADFWNLASGVKWPHQVSMAFPSIKRALSRCWPAEYATYSTLLKWPLWPWGSIETTLI